MAFRSGRALVLVAVLGCSHDPSGAAAAPGGSAPAVRAAPSSSEAVDVPSPSPSPSPPSAAAPTLATAGEAHRTIIARLEADPTLVPQLPALRDHFGAGSAGVKGPFSVQHIELANENASALVMRADESDPIAIAFDRDRLLWSKVRPTAGILTPVTGLTIAARPDGGEVLFAWVVPLHMVAARMWADDGNPFGDFELFAPDACDALSAAYGPGEGWITVCTSAQGTHAQRMREDATIAWGHAGLAVGAPGRSGPAAIAFDAPGSFVLFERVPAVGGEHLLAFRYDDDAQPEWPAPVDLGVDLGSRPAPAARTAVRVVRDGVVAIERPAGVAGKGAAKRTELTSAGEVHFL